MTRRRVEKSNYFFFAFADTDARVVLRLRAALFCAPGPALEAGETGFLGCAEGVALLHGLAFPPSTFAVSRSTSRRRPRRYRLLSNT